MRSRGIFHKNRSQGSLLSTQETSGRRSYQASPIDSPLNSPGFPPPASAVSPLAREEEEEADYRFHNPADRPEDPRLYQSALSRSHSQRSSVPAQHVRNPTIQLVGPPSGRPQFVEDNPDDYYREAAPEPPRKEEPKKRRFFKLGGHGSSSREQVTGPPNNANKLGRSVSVRRNDPRNDPQNPHPYRGAYEQQRLPSDPSSLAYRPSIDQEEAGNGYGGPQPVTQRFAPSVSGPPIPEKDILRYDPQLVSPGQQDSTHSRPYLTGVKTNSLQDQDEWQTVESDTTWDNSSRTGQQTAHYRRPSEQNSNTPHQPSSAASHHPSQPYQASPSSTTSVTSHPLRGPQDPLQQWRQDLHSTSRPASQQSSYNGPPSPLRPPSRQEDIAQERQGASLSAPGPRGNMPPPGPNQGKLLNEHGQQGQQSGISREHSGYQPYNQVGQSQIPQQGGPPSYDQLNANYQGQNYRGAPQPSPMPIQTNPGDQQGRSTPPPSRSRDDLSGLDVAQLLSRHDELQDKYRKVKKYYFDKDAQVQSLQNTLAHTRLSQSRTSLDDNEYTNRMSRLDGAINNLAFNIRREWASIPPWLGPYINKDALTSPTKEMTAVGRAFISRWLVDEILDRYFLPGLEPGLSMQLKIIERNLRRFAAPAQSEEEKEMLVARISNWRLATLDGLHEMLCAPQAIDQRAQLTGQLVEKLTASLGMLLKDPPPLGLEGSVTMIVELAVGIAANLPLESRDVFITYILPGTPVNEAIMKIEQGIIPPLTNPGDGIHEEGGGKADDGASMSTSNTQEAGKDSSETDDSQRPSLTSVNQQLQQEGKPPAAQQQQQQQQVQKKRGMFGGLMTGGSSGNGGSGGGKLQKGGLGQQQQGQQVQPQGPPQGQQQGQQQQQQQPAPQPPKEERVRFSAFMACEVRGRSVLVKAPCYTI